MSRTAPPAREALWPLCAICRRPVARVTEEPLEYSYRVRFVAECHGEQETVELSALDLAGAVGIRGGVAFGRVSLPNGQ